MGSQCIERIQRWLLSKSLSAISLLRLDALFPDGAPAEVGRASVEGRRVVVPRCNSAVRDAVGLVAQHRLDESLDFAIPLRRVRRRRDVTCTDLDSCRLERLRREDLAVTHEYPLDCDAAAFVRGGEPTQEVCGAMACRLASSMPTKPTSLPGARERRRRSPSMRCPTPWKRRMPASEGDPAREQCLRCEITTEGMKIDPITQRSKRRESSRALGNAKCGRLASDESYFA